MVFSSGHLRLVALLSGEDESQLFSHRRIRARFQTFLCERPISQLQTNQNRFTVLADLQIALGDTVQYTFPIRFLAVEERR